VNYHDGKAAVLVVEDDPALLRLMERMLTGGGFETVTATEATDGLSLVRACKGAFQLAIIDMVMHETSGLDLAADLGREYPSLKILYISGYAGSLAAEAIARRSPQRVLLKPFTELALLDRMRMLLAFPAHGEAGQASPTAARALRSGTRG
jgi:CheY-like chemotaxis protein